MKLYEFEGKELFRTYGIPTPAGIVARRARDIPAAIGRVMVKAQVKSGDRKKAGGIISAATRPAVIAAFSRLKGKNIQGEIVEQVLVEERIAAHKEYYVSISYDSDHRTPMLALSPKGGSGVAKAHLAPIHMLWGIPTFFARDALAAAGFPNEDSAGVSRVLQNLYELFVTEHALLAEINPLFKTSEGAFVAGDAKIILDDEKIKPDERRIIAMDGDIAVLASGGGASMLNIDALLSYGGRPANYTEYSGNPPAHMVKKLTKQVLDRRGLKGCWVVGGIANFTDIFETLTGFLQGLREITPKPLYPIVIRRDGPRQKEAFAMLREAGEKEGYDFHVFGSETPMVETARIMVQEAYHKNARRATA